MTGEVLHGALTLAVLVLGRLLQHGRAVRPAVLDTASTSSTRNSMYASHGSSSGGVCSPRTSATITAPSSRIRICERSSIADPNPLD